MESHCTKHRQVLAQSHIQSYTFDCNSQLATKPKNCRVLNKVAIFAQRHWAENIDTALKLLLHLGRAKDQHFSYFHSSCQWGLRYTCTLNRRLHFLTLWHWAEIHSSICSWACHASMDYELNRNGPENIWIEQWNHKKILFLFARSLHNNQSAANNAAIFQSQGSYVY